MKFVLAFSAFTALVSATAASAEMKKSQFAASNGVVVDVNSDEFAGRAEYSAPAIRFKVDRGGTGYALVAKVKHAGEMKPLNVQGFIMYSGDWRFYNSAIFKGGAEAPFKSLGRDVGSCRYGCTLTENFLIELTPEQVSEHAENGVVPIQIRGKSADTAIIQIPVSYIQAVNEVAR